MLEVVPGSKCLKPVLDTLGDAAEFLFKYGEEFLRLAKINGVVKFTDDAVQQLAARATRNASSNMVMLGKEYYSGTLSYFERAGND